MTRLTKNVIYNVTGQGLVLVLSLIAVRFIFRRLGDDVFGIIYFNLVLTTVLGSALELGISATIVREVSSYYETDRDYVKALIRTASFLYWGFGLVLVAFIWLAAPLLVTHWVNLKSIDAGTAATILRILSASAMVTLPKALYTSVFRGRQVMALNNAIDVGTAVAQQAGILLLLLGGAHVYEVAAWISLSWVLGIVAYVLVAARLVGWSTLRPAFSAQVVRRTIGFTGNMMVISAFSLVNSQAAQVIVSKLLPIAEFGFYGFAASTVNRGSFITSAVSQAAFPSFSNLFAAGDRPALLRQYGKLQDLVCYGTLPLFAGISFLALPVNTYVFNSSVAQQLLLPTALLCLGTWMNASLSVPYMLSVAVGKPQIAARLNTYALVVVLPVTAALILVFGLPGAGFSWVFYNLFAYTYMIPRVCRACLHTRAATWYLHLLKVLSLGVATYGPAWLVLSRIYLYSLPIAIAAYAVSSAAFGIGAYLLIGQDLRQTIQRLRGTFSVRKAGAL